MRYTKRTLIISQSTVSEAEQREVVERLGDAHDPLVDATALLLVMEQSLLSMKRFLATLERDLELSMGLGKPLRRKASRHQAEGSTTKLAQQVVHALRDGGIDAKLSKIDGPGGATQISDPSGSRLSR
jgi:hypothetical protein